MQRYEKQNEERGRNNANADRVWESRGGNEWEDMNERSKKWWGTGENRQEAEIGEKEEDEKDLEKLSQVYCIY